MKPIPRILLLPGEPAGIGPDITILAAQQNFNAELVTIADPELLLTRANQLKIPLKLISFTESEKEIHQPGTLKIISVSLKTKCQPGKLNPENAFYVIGCLQKAVEFCLTKKVDAMVTGPVNKGVMNDAGIKFSGHTEFLADYCRVKKTVMLFVANKLKVALATTHLPLKEVSKKITQTGLIETIKIIHTNIKNLFQIANPKIIVAGLNPHAGENGHLGMEELEVISPAIAFLKKEKIDVAGPFPADTIFSEKFLQTADVILAMYHDQALPVVKVLSFGNAVNVTLGLPILRTSVDHGTACDIAGTGQANPNSLFEAIRLAIFLSALNII